MKTTVISHGFLATLLTILVSVTATYAQTITLTLSDASGVSSFNSAGAWSNGAAPSAGNNYEDQWNLLRTPGSVGNYTFAGDSLKLYGFTSIMAYKGTGSSDVITVNTLIMENYARVSNYSGGAAFTLAGNISLLPHAGTSTFSGAIDLHGGFGITVSSTISGAGSLGIINVGGTVQSSKAIVLTKANSYLGGTTVQSYAYLDVQTDGALGIGNLTMSGGQLKLEGGITNNYIDDSAQLLLSSSLASGAVNLSFTGADTITALSFDGGATFAQAGTWGAIGSGALNTSNLFTGTGILTVVPEPQSYLLLIGGVLLCATRMRCRSRSFSLLSIE